MVNSNKKGTKTYNSTFLKSSYILFFLFLNPSVALSGLDKFTHLDEVSGWLIERKFDSSTDSVYCRASIPGYGTWFSARIRLNEDGYLLLPPNEHPSKLTEPSLIEEVKDALRNCRSGLIYM